MDVRHLELLRELADRGSITAVARATHRTPSAVSQQLRTAQREFSAPLVEPAGRGLRLTEAGELLAAGGRDVARVVAEVQARWDGFLDEPSGTVTIAALPSAATFLLPGTLRELAPTSIEIVCTDLDIAEEEYAALVTDHDIVIAHSLTAAGPIGTEHLVTAELAREPLDIAMRAGHRLVAGDVVRADDLINEEWYGVPLGYPFDTVRIAVEEATDRAVNVVQRLRDNRLIEELVAHSDGVAVLPRFTTPPTASSGAPITLRPLAGIKTGRHIVAVLRPDRAERLAVRRVLDALRRVGQATATAAPAADPLRSSGDPAACSSQSS